MQFFFENEYALMLLKKFSSLIIKLHHPKIISDHFRSDQIRSEFCGCILGILNMNGKIQVYPHASINRSGLNRSMNTIDFF